MNIFICLLLIALCNYASADFMIDQRYREHHKIYPPLDPFFNTFYDKSYYYTGIQRPVYHVDATTVYGRVRGTSYQVKTESLYNNQYYYYYVSAFLGIPYAMPPTGENRFQVRKII